jgi:hypothetical protein
MRAINHAMTGAIIGLTVHEPLLAVPAAIASHFVLDALPHFGERIDSWTSPVFRFLLGMDAVLCFALVLTIFLIRPDYWLLAIVCATLAAGVDFIQARRYFRVALHHDLRGMPGNIVESFHARIQWFQKPIGMVVEFVWAAAAAYFLIYLL